MSNDQLSKEHVDVLLTAEPALLARVVMSGFGDMVIRFGHARPAATTARRPVGDCIRQDHPR